ncbi:N-acetyltransferase [Mycetocola tolaasinivorans]|uniref:N-acetyltransferase n=1 Tax=Mycetocola tolaasinivorans TaxID=76635 RepID=A0A3L7A8D2_9MICO|nr:GNAT family N-acetyltransferase [Mycetocola tolaasinivorans]RLP76355.1 N-acetyltransferase [Mycetocola tolaasinivorans]
MTWILRPSTPEDAAWIAELRAEVLRPDLERLGRYDPVRVRERFTSAFRPELTRVIVVDGESVGSVSVRPEPDARWIEHLYLSTRLQGRGIGGAVLAEVLAEADSRPFKLNVLQGSRARDLYVRLGFVTDSEDPVDVFMSRPKASA